MFDFFGLRPNGEHDENPKRTKFSFKFAVSFDLGLGGYNFEPRIEANAVDRAKGFCKTGKVGVVVAV